MTALPAGPTPEVQIAALVDQADVVGADLVSIGLQLTGLCRRFSVDGLPVQSLAAIEAAVDVLSRGSPRPGQEAAFETLLAESLHTLAARLVEAGRSAEAADRARQAIPVYRSAAALGGPLREITANLGFLSKFLTSLVLPSDALAAQNAVVEALSAHLPAVGMTVDDLLDLANAHHNRAARLIDLQRGDEAAAAVVTASPVYREAATLTIARLSQLASEVTSKSLRLQSSGTPSEQECASAVQQALFALMASWSVPDPPPARPMPNANGISSRAQEMTDKADEMRRENEDHLRAVKDAIRKTIDLMNAVTAGIASGLVGGLSEIAQLATRTVTTTFDSVNSARFCGVPDDAIGTGVAPMTFGAPHGRWRKGELVVSVNTAGCNLVNLPAPAAPTDPLTVIRNAFLQWERVAVTSTAGFFRFTFVGPGMPADITVSFVGKPAVGAFGAPGGVAGVGAYPESGTLQLDNAESWTPGLLLGVALHEIGHVLGLSHSNTPGETMYPIGGALQYISSQSVTALGLLYGWLPQQRLTDRSTSHRACLGRTTATNFADHLETPQMVWKGTGDDQGIYQAELRDSWTAQERVSGIGSSHSPALASIAVPGSPTPATGLLMAWKGLEGDPGIYWSRIGETDWTPQQRVPGVGTSRSPALADLNGTVFMAWKGVGDDEGIYWSAFDGTATWTPQNQVRGVGTTDSPAIVGFDDKLHMFWKGANGDNFAYYSSLDVVTELIWRPQRRVEYSDYETGGGVPFAIGTSGALSATSGGDDVILAWKGLPGDQGIWISVFDGLSFSGQVNVPNIGTAVGPTVVHAGDQLLMAWKGIDDDDTIYWSRL